MANDWVDPQIEQARIDAIQPWVSVILWLAVFYRFVFAMVALWCVIAAIVLLMNGHHVVEDAGYWWRVMGLLVVGVYGLTLTVKYVRSPVTSDLLACASLAVHGGVSKPEGSSNR